MIRRGGIDTRIEVLVQRITFGVGALLGGFSLGGLVEDVRWAEAAGWSDRLNQASAHGIALVLARTACWLTEVWRPSWFHADE